MAQSRFLPPTIAALLATNIAACSTDGAGDTVRSAGQSAAQGISHVPSLVNVDLSNVLNDLSVRLHLDRANVPINAQIPITLAANICGVSINILSASTGGKANCTATTSSPELAQVVQQQLAAGGNVGGGAQGGSTATNGAAAGSAGQAGSGASGTSGQSSGMQSGSAPTSGTTGTGTGTSTSTGTSTGTSTAPQPTTSPPASTNPSQTPR